MILWTLINDFLHYPEKYDLKTILENESTDIQNSRIPPRESE